MDMSSLLWSRERRNGRQGAECSTGNKHLCLKGAEREYGDLDCCPPSLCHFPHLAPPVLPLTLRPRYCTSRCHQSWSRPSGRIVSARPSGSGGGSSEHSGSCEQRGGGGAHCISQALRLGGWLIRALGQL